MLNYVTKTFLTKKMKRFRKAPKSSTMYFIKIKNLISFLKNITRSSVKNNCDIKVALNYGINKYYSKV